MLEKALSRLLGRPEPAASQLGTAKDRWRAGEHAAAIELLRGQCRALPEDGEAHALLGGFLIERAREVHARAAARRGAAKPESDACYREAVEHLRRAAALLPEAAAPMRHCGLALRELGELVAAHEALLAAHRAAPQDPDLGADLAFGLQCLGRTDEAIALYQQIIAGHPESANAHAGLALSLLGAGDYARGWEEYEWRLRVPSGGIRREFPFPLWQGEDLSGRGLFVYSEQGIGDEIMFASCFHELLSMAGHCVLESSKRLVPLFARSFPEATLLARDRSRMPDWSQLPAIDVHVAAGSVPRILRNRAQAFPRREAYLRADPSRVERWRERLTAAAGPGSKVGIAWTGGLPGTLRAARSVSLEALRPLLATPGASFVALEFLDCGAEAAAFNGGGGERVHWWPEALKTLDETAALVAALDLVITVTTATAHLAGALGRPTWVLVPSVPTWRYMWQGERVPWYASMRVLRGHGAGGVTALVEETRILLDRFIRTATPPPG
jgi:Flp pilus assembly protein TadD